MMRLAAALSILFCARAFADDAPAPAQTPDAVPQLQDELKQDADLLQSMTDAEYAIPAGRAKAAGTKKADDQSDQAAAADAVDASDPRLSRPKSLALIYETLASYEYQAAARSGALAAPEAQQVAARSAALAAKPLLVDPKTQKPAKSWSKLSSYIQSRKTGVQQAGRSSAPADKRAVALNAKLASINKELSASGTPAARQAALHVEAGRVYERLADASEYENSVAVVDGSVLADSGDAKPARKASAVKAAKLGKLEALAAKVRGVKGKILVKTPAAGAAGAKKAGKPSAVAQNRVTRATALRSIYRQMAARDYRSCMTAGLPKGANAKLKSALRRLAVAGERAGWEDPGDFDAAAAASADDAIAQACGCPSGTTALGEDSYGLCYCADQSSDQSAPADAPMDQTMTNLDQLVDITDTQLASRETPKGLLKAKIPAQTQWRYQKAQLYERMAAAATKAAFPKARLAKNGKTLLQGTPTAGRLQKIAVQIRAGRGPLILSRKSRKAGARERVVARGAFLKRTYQTMAALDYRAAMIAGLPAGKFVAAKAGAARIQNSIAAGGFHRKARKVKKAEAKIADDEDDSSGAGYSSGGDDSGGGDYSTSEDYYSGGGSDYSSGDDGSSGDATASADDASSDDSYAAATDFAVDLNESGENALNDDGGDGSDAGAADVADAGNDDAAATDVADSGGDSSGADAADAGDQDAAAPVDDGGADPYSGTALTDGADQDPDSSGADSYTDTYQDDSGEADIAGADAQDQGGSAADETAASDDETAAADDAATTPCDPSVSSCADSVVYATPDDGGTGIPGDALGTDDGVSCQPAGAYGRHSKKADGLVAKCAAAAAQAAVTTITLPQVLWQTAATGAQTTMPVVYNWLNPEVTPDVAPPPATPATGKDALPPCPLNRCDQQVANDLCVNLQTGDPICRMVTTAFPRGKKAKAAGVCPGETVALHASKKGFAVCSLPRQKAGKVAAAAKKSGKPLLHKLATLDRAAGKVSQSLATRGPRAKKALLFLKRAQLYERMAAAIPARPSRKAKLAKKVAAKKGSRPVTADAPPAAQTEPPPAAPAEQTPAPQAAQAPPPQPAPPAAAAPESAPAPTAEDVMKKDMNDLDQMGKQMHDQVQERTAVPADK